MRSTRAIFFFVNRNNQYTLNNDPAAMNEKAQRKVGLWRHSSTRAGMTGSADIRESGNGSQAAIPTASVSCALNRWDLSNRSAPIVTALKGQRRSWPEMPETICTSPAAFKYLPQISQALPATDQ